MKKAKEAIVEINGNILSIGQSLTLRVAVSEFFVNLERKIKDLEDNSNDQIIYKTYLENCNHILKYIFE